MNSTDRLQACYPEFLQTADPRTEAVISALDTAYSAKAPEQLRARIAQLPRQAELHAGNIGADAADIHPVRPVDRKTAAGIQLHPWRPRLGVHAVGSKPLISFMTVAVTMTLVLVLVFAEGPSLRRISSTSANYGVGNTARPTACELAATRFPKGILQADQGVVRVVPAAQTSPDQVVIITSGVPKPRYHDAYLSCSATPFRGGRVRMSAEIKLDSVAALAGLFMGIRSSRDFHSSYGWLRDDPMEDRPITGSVAWRTYSVVLDVPKASVAIQFGPWIEGVGTLSIRNLRFASVSADVAVTNFSSRPCNLNFSHGLTAWFRAGSAPNSFTTEILPHGAPDGGVSLLVRPDNMNIRQAGNVQQNMSATGYLGKRIRLSEDIKHSKWLG